MRRGGIVILLIGVIIALAAAGLLFLILQNGNGVGSGGPTATPTEDPGREVVIARVDIPANTLISDPGTLLETTTISSNDFSPNYFSSINDVAGKLTVSNIRANQPIEESDITEPGLSQQIPTAEADAPRPKAYAFSVSSLTGVADQIKMGDVVDVVATFRIPRRISYPSERRLEEQAGQTVPVLTRNLELVEFATTKTIVQQAQVLRIVRPPVATEGTPGPEGGAPEGEGPPATDETGQPATDQGSATTITQGTWLLVLAINDQEAELIEFAIHTDANISLVLRGAGDTNFEPTIGATFDLLVSEFGVPLPEQLPPRVYGEEVFVPDPTRTPAPTRVP